MRHNQGIWDAHVHTHGGCTVDGYLRNGRDNLSASGLDGMNLLCVRHGRSACISDAEALLLKALLPGRFTVYCNPAFQIEEFGSDAEGLFKQILGFAEAGADGVKLGDGEAGENVNLDSPLYDAIFSALEKTDLPALFHVGAAPYIPARRYFQKNKYPVAGPPWMVYTGKQDDDQEATSRISRENLAERHQQIDNLLSRHPNARVTFAHFFFKADDLDGMADFLNRYPNIRIDIPPCSDLYYHLSQTPKRSRDFFETYSDRLIFGTDNEMELDPVLQISLIRQFLETDETFFSVKYGFDITGIAPLQKETLKKIYCDNFRKMVPGTAVNAKKAASYCEYLYETVKEFAEMPKENALEVLEVARRFQAMRGS